MRHVTDNLHHDFILALRIAGYVNESALVAHYTTGSTRASHIKSALENADKVTAAAAALRAEIARLEAERDEVAA